VNADKNRITGNNITTIGDGSGTATTVPVGGEVDPGNGKFTRGVYLEACSNNVFDSNNVHTTGNTATVDWSDMYSGGIYSIIGFFISTDSNNNTLTNNNITTDYNQIHGSYDTILGVAIHSGSNNNKLIGNTFNTTGYSYAYGLEIRGGPDYLSSSTVVSNNTITSGAIREDETQSYANGIKVTAYANNTLVTGNNITAVAYRFSYPIYLEDFGSEYEIQLGPSTITGNNIYGAAQIIYGFELFYARNQTITNNTITGEGNYFMGIGTYGSSNNNITHNNINITGDTSIPIGYNVDSIPASNEGIKIYYGSHNNIIDSNYVFSPDDVYAVNISDDSTGNKGTNNYLYSDNGNKLGNNAVNPGTGNTVTGNYGPDSIAPTITSTDPANGATKVATSKTIKITFNENIKAGTNWVELKNSKGTAIPFTTSISGKILTINPKSNLAESLYTLTIHTGAVTDLAGNPIAYTTSKFITGTPPTVTSVNPANNKVIKVANKALVITFSENIKAGSAFTSIKVTNPDGVKVKPLYKVINGKTLTLTRNGNYINGLTYTITLPTNSITDTAGNPITAYTSKFTVDFAKPTVTSVNPANNKVINVANKALVITFSENIKAGSAFTSIKVTNPDGVKVKPLYKVINGKTLTLTRNGNYINGLTYTITLPTNSITDTAGNTITAYTSKFKIDTTRPKITSVNPANTATKVARNKNIKITFNENIKTSNNPRIELKTNNGTPVKTGKSINGKTLTITHTKLKANTKYKLTIHTGAITDTAGNPLAAKTITFTTGNT
jgi:methionine-rich copper-binding protein CopC